MLKNKKAAIKRLNVYNTIKLANSTLFFYLISSQHEFLIIVNSDVREELSYLPFFIQTQLQKITMEEHIFGAFAFVHLTFSSCTSPTETPPYA